MAKRPGLGALVSKSPRLTRGPEVRFGIREGPLGFWQWVVVPDSVIGPGAGCNSGVGGWAVLRFPCWLCLVVLAGAPYPVVVSGSCVFLNLT